MREYKIVMIAFDGNYFPTELTVRVKAKCLEDAIFSALFDKMRYLDLDDAEDAKEEIKEELGYNMRSNEGIALAYNSLLDRDNSYYRLAKGYLGKRKIFDVVIKEEEIK